MKKLFVLIGIIAIVSVSFLNPNDSKKHNDLGLSSLMRINTANAEGSASCSTVCEGGCTIEVCGCQYCSSRNADYVRCYDEDDILIDEWVCAYINCA